MLKFFNNLSEKFYNIRLNIINSHNKKIQKTFNYDKIKEEMTIKYEEIKNDIDNLDNLEIELKNLVEQMKDEDEVKERDKKLNNFKEKCKLFKDKLNNKIVNFCKFLDKKKPEILKQSYDNLIDNDSLSIKLKIRNNFNLPFLLGSGGIFGAAAGLYFDSLSSLYLMQNLIFVGSFSLIGVLGFGLIYGAKKFINYIGKKKDIDESFEKFFENLKLQKVKFKEQIEKIYNEKIKEIDNIIKSQNVIYNDINKWNDIIDDFQKLKMRILKNLNENKY